MSARPLGAVDAGAAAGPAPERERLSSQLLGPFAREIARARAVRFLPYGAMENVDLHALPFEGGALLDHVDVAYGVDLPWRAPPGDAVAPGTSAGSPPTRLARSALLVGDPDLTLPDARAEVDVIAPLLAGQFDLNILRAGEAKRDALLDALATVSLFHFAGHAWHAGLDGLDSGLGAAGGEKILIGDVLTLRHSPQIVVLSACESGRAVRIPPGRGTNSRLAGRGLPGGWGVAQAFLAAGSEAVVAPVRAVTDKESAAFARTFYQAWAAAPDRSAAATVRAAWLGRERTAAGDNGSLDTASFRVLVP